MLDNYDDVFVEIDGNDKGVVPTQLAHRRHYRKRQKSNTNQVFIEETRIRWDTRRSWSTRRVNTFHGPAFRSDGHSR